MEHLTYSFSDWFFLWLIGLGDGITEFLKRIDDTIITINFHYQGLGYILVALIIIILAIMVFTALEFNPWADPKENEQTLAKSEEGNQENEGRIGKH